MYEDLDHFTIRHKTTNSKFNSIKNIQMTQNNTKLKYSEVLISIIEKFDEYFSKELTLEERLDIVIDSWNLANNKDFLIERKLYKEELNERQFSSIVEKIVNYKSNEYPNLNNVIIGYNIKGNKLQVKTQSQENYFDGFLRNMVNYNPDKKKL